MERKRNAGQVVTQAPDFASAHPGYRFATYSIVKQPARPHRRASSPAFFVEAPGSPVVPFEFLNLSNERVWRAERRRHSLWVRIRCRMRRA